MPNAESLTCRPFAPCLDAKEPHKTKPGNVSLEIGTPKYLDIPSGRIVQFYKQRENSPEFLFESRPKLRKIINEEFKTELYRDRKFPADRFSLGDCKTLPGNISIKWKRPHEITADPKFVVAEPSNFDITQGLLKNCWFLAAVASLATREDLLNQVVPMEQGFDGPYAGIFCFRFWQYGKWVDVVVDDYLPTYITEDEDKKPVMKLFGAQPASGNIFWLPLLEKAYAKLHGSYRAIEGPKLAHKNPDDVSSGWPSDAMEDFTGGISEYYSAALNGEKKNDQELKKKLDCYKIARKAWTNESFVTCNFRNWDTTEKEVEENHNKNEARQTWPNHWSITHFFSISTSKSERSCFLRIRYPDHENSKLTRKWDEKFEEMKDITEPERNKLKNHVDSKPLRKGEFIMSEKEFNEKCTSMEICHLNLNQFSNSVQKEWELCEIHGEWSGTSAGGLSKTEPGKFIAGEEPQASYDTNPRYHFKLEMEGIVIIALMQKHQWENDPTGAELRQIGFDIYSMNEGAPPVLPYPLNTKDFYSKAPKVPFNEHKSEFNERTTETFPAPDSMQNEKYTRESNCRLKLKSGSYCIVVYTDGRGENGNFFLRIFSDTKITMQPDPQWPKRSPQNPCCNEANETPMT